MSNTLLGMSQRVARDAGYSGNIQSVAVVSGDAARIVQYVKDATTYIENLWGDWRFLWGGMLEGIVDVGETHIVPPLGHYRWDQARLMFDNHLVYPELFHNFSPYSTMLEQGYPTQFVIMPDSSIQMYPRPDKQFNFQFSWYRESVELVNDSDTPLVPARFCNTIVAYALWLYAMYDDAAELAAKSQAEYEKYLRLLEADQRPDGFPTNQSSGNFFNVTAD